jgi:CheY-like chemotaxis protein
MEGFETILALQRLDPDVKIIAVTAADEDRALVFLESAKLFAAVRAVHKPFSRDELLTIVGEVLAA